MDNATGAVQYFRDERIPRSLRWTWPLFSRLMGVQATRRRMQPVQHLQNLEFVNGMLRVLDVETDSTDLSRRSIPTDRPLIVVANHHLGAIDGLLIFSHVLPLRPDLKVAVNKYNMPLVPQMRDLFLSVSPPTDRAGALDAVGMRNVYHHLQANGALMLFPSGQVASYTRWGLIEDGPWSPTLGRLIHKFRADVLPIGVQGRNSRLFCLLRALYLPLSLPLLLHEMLNKVGAHVPIHVGPRIAYADMADIPNSAELTHRLREVIYSLVKHGAVSPAVALSTT